MFDCDEIACNFSIQYANETLERCSQKPCVDRLLLRNHFLVEARLASGEDAARATGGAKLPKDPRESKIGN